MATLKPIDTKKLVKELAKVSSAAILKRHGDLVHQFVYPTRATDGQLTADPSFGGSKGERCAFSFNSGGKEISNHVSDSAASHHHVSEDQCSRTGYRFSLIEVLSRLHDDQILFNNRRTGQTDVQSHLNLYNRTGFSLNGPCV